MIGTERQIDYGVSASRGEGLSRASISNTKARGLSDSSGVGYSESVKEAARVSQNNILRLGQGECIIQYDGDKVYHVRIPFLKFTPEFKAEMGNSFVPNRRRQRRVPGVYAYRIAQEMIDESERNGSGA
ncbi:MAG: hypothetical protein DDT34_02097 [Firmicutes bacterium]|nr:hypothetical protein [Bacillota bacterium]